MFVAKPTVRNFYLTLEVAVFVFLMDAARFGWIPAVLFGASLIVFLCLVFYLSRRT